MASAQMAAVAAGKDALVVAQVEAPGISQEVDVAAQL
jgi:hypothetical protein